MSLKTPNFRASMLWRILAISIFFVWSVFLVVKFSLSFCDLVDFVKFRNQACGSREFLFDDLGELLLVVC